MRRFLSILVISLFTLACNNNLDIKNSNPLVKVQGKILYKNALNDIIPAGLSKEDSIIAAEYFIRAWINENLLYDLALKNINNKENVELLVENYRKSLLINQFQEQLVNERLSKEIDEQSLYDYYNNNKEILKLEKPLVKGLFLKVPENAPQLDEIRRWYKLITPNSRESLEKYSLSNAVVFEFFVNNWMDFSDVMDNFPQNKINKEDFNLNKKTIEKQDNGYYYLLNITDFLQPGANAPYEYVKNTVKEILINQRRIDFLKKTEEELYKRALDKGDIQFYNE